MTKLSPICVLTLLMSCAGTTASQRSGASWSSPTTSAIGGVVTAGPTCPIERVGHPCAPAPVVARIEANDAGGRVRAATTSTADGHFVVPVSPGGYTVVVGTRMVPRCPATAVRVRPNARAAVMVACDTGIR